MRQSAELVIRISMTVFGSGVATHHHSDSRPVREVLVEMCLVSVCSDPSGRGQYL